MHTPLKPHTHHHGKKEKSKKGPKKKKHDDTSKKQSPEKEKIPVVEEEGSSEVKELPEEKLERNIVDQTISVLPEIGEDEILATPPKQGFLSELSESVADAPVVEKEAKVSRHRQKNEQNEKKDTTPSKGRHHRHHRHRHKSELQERRRPGVATIKEKDAVTPTVSEAPDEAGALDLKDVEDITCKFFFSSEEIKIV